MEGGARPDAAPGPRVASRRAGIGAWRQHRSGGGPGLHALHRGARHRAPALQGLLDWSPETAPTSPPRRDRGRLRRGVCTCGRGEFVTFICGRRAGVCALGAAVAKHAGDEVIVARYLSSFKKVTG
uniref:Uncharacterized protein n=1 Tax=Setaria viridis TaxID=4556 RepID=A0A4U6TSD9_SETVI|nr:hypothetical protein SEVIR_7G186475v2 [Setaria viridis]